MPILLDKPAQRSKRRGTREPLSDYRAIVESSGDIEIGARARRVRQRRVVVGLAGLTLLALAVGAYWALQGPSEADPSSYLVKVHCNACHLYEERLVTARTTFPLRCGRCNESLAQQVWTCRVCGAEFEPQTGPQFLECPSCRSLRVGSPIHVNNATASPATDPR